MNVPDTDNLIYQILSICCIKLSPPIELNNAFTSFTFHAVNVSAIRTRAGLIDGRRLAWPNRQLRKHESTSSNRCN